MSIINSESLEEVGLVYSDEQSSGILSFLGQLDILLIVVQGMVCKVGVLVVKNFLVYKKNKKVELVIWRKWKYYWVFLKGCMLFFYESDGRFGIDYNSIFKYVVWVENSIVQVVFEYFKKDFVFCFSNFLGDVFFFQIISQMEFENWIIVIYFVCVIVVVRYYYKEDIF